MNWGAKWWSAAWIALLLAVASGCEPGYVKNTARFADRVKSVVNPDELQAWATNRIGQTRVAVGTTGDIKQADIPQALRGLYEFPPDADISAPEGSTPYVTIWYGSGHGHWGLYVGDPTLVKSSSQTHYIVPWKAGIYFWNGP